MELINSIGIGIMAMIIMLLFIAMITKDGINSDKDAGAALSAVLISAVFGAGVALFFM